MNAQSISLATVSTSAAAPEPGLAEVLRDVRDVIRQLENAGTHDAPLGAIVRCNASLEQCLDGQREVIDRDAGVANAKEDLKRLSALLTEVDPADVPMVMRQMRRILGRFDRR